jgi:hypothetical protein
MAAGSANCINCYIDRDIDQVMGRTQRRSLPSGRVQPTQALIFGVVLGVGAFLVLTTFVNLLSACLACSAILFYVFVYTMGLKRTSAQNIVIGGAAGRRDQQPLAPRHLALRHHLLLDAPALLGALTLNPERLREGAHSHVTRRHG